MKIIKSIQYEINLWHFTNFRRVLDFIKLSIIKPLHIRFNKINGFIRVCGNEFRYLLLFDYRLLDKICDKIKYLISEKSGIADSINYNFRKIRVDSYNSLPIEKILTFHNFIFSLSQLLMRIKITTTTIYF